MTVITKVTSWHFEISNLKILKKIEIFDNMGPYGSENFKTLLLLQLLFFFNQTFGNVLYDSTSPHKRYL